MICRNYHSSIHIHHPQNYFERWYADVWKRRLVNVEDSYGKFYHIMEEELTKIGAVDMAPPENAYFELVFKDDRDYTMFVMRWA